MYMTGQYANHANFYVTAFHTVSGIGGKTKVCDINEDRVKKETQKRAD